MQENELGKEGRVLLLLVDRNPYLLVLLINNLVSSQEIEGVKAVPLKNQSPLDNVAVVQRTFLDIIELKVSNWSVHKSSPS